MQAWAQVYAIRRTCVHLEALEGQTYACLYWVLTLHGGAIGVINTRHQSCSHHTSQTLSASYIKKKKTHTHTYFILFFFILQRFVFFSGMYCKCFLTPQCLVRKSGYTVSVRLWCVYENVLCISERGIQFSLLSTLLSAKIPQT